MNLDISDAPVQPGKGPVSSPTSELPSIDTTDAPVKPGAGSLQETYDLASKINPDKAAQVLSTSKILSMDDPMFVARNLEMAKSAAAAPSPDDLQNLPTTHPATADFLRDPKNMVRAHDDIPNLTLTEKLLNGIRDVFSMSKSNAEIGELQAQENRLYSGTVLGQNNADRIAQIQEQIKARTPSGKPGVLKQAAAGALQFAPQIVESQGYGAAGALAGAGMAAVTVPPIIPLAAGAGYGVGEAYYWGQQMIGQAKKQLSLLRDENGQPLSERTQNLMALAIGSAMTAPSMFAVGNVLKTVPGGQELMQDLTETVGEKALASPGWRDSLMSFVENGLKSSGAFGTTMAALSGIQTEGEKLAEFVSGQPFKPTTAQDTLKQMAEAGGMGALTGGIMAAPGLSWTLGGDFLRLHGEAQRAEAARQFVQNMNETSIKSKLRERAPEDYADHINKAAEGTPARNVLIPVQAFDAYFQGKNINPQQAAIESKVSDSYAEARQTGGNVSIPLGTFQSKLWDAHRVGLVDDIKFDPEDRTANEIKTEVGEQQEQAKASQEKIVKEAESVRKLSPEMEEGYAKVYQDIKEKYGAVPSPKGMAPAEFGQLVDSVAALNASRWVMEAQKQGRRVEEAYGTGPGVEGEQLDPNAVTISVVRHGTTKLNSEDRLRGWNDVPLDEQGKQDAAKLAQAYQGQRVDRIYSSDLDRAHETAKAISDVTGAPIETDKNLRPINFGEWNGQKVSDIQERMDQLHERWKTNPDEKAPGGESFKDFQDRNIEAFKKILGEAKSGEHIVFTGHLRNTKLIKAIAANGGNPLEGEKLDLLNRADQEPGDVSVFQFHPETGKLTMPLENVFEGGHRLGDQTGLQGLTSEGRPSGTGALAQASNLGAFDKSITDHPIFVKAQEEAKPVLGENPTRDQAVDAYIKAADDLHDLKNQLMVKQVKGWDEGEKETMSEKMKDATSRLLATRRLAFIAHNGDKALQHFTNLDAGEEPKEKLEDPYDARYFKQSQIPAKTDTPEFKNWFGDSKVVDEKGKPLVVYHGSRRPDRIGDRFRKSRATSGPMAFFTNSQEIGSNYATGKADTSIEDTHYESWYKFKPRGARTPVDIDKAWWHIPEEQRQKIADLAPHITQDDDNNIVEEKDNDRGLGAFDQHLKESRGNVLKALVEEWLTSGALYDREEEFGEVLKKAGMTGFKYESPYAEHPGVIPVYLSIKNPLDTTAIPQNVIDALEARAPYQKRPPPEGMGADMWDKTRRDAKEWVEQLKKDQAEGKNSFVWSSIPDWVTDSLKKLGYDGIKDTGGKGGGQGHDVWIPFEESQVKSSVGNRGTFDQSSPNILHQGAATAPMFYSKLQRDIEARLPEKATQGQLEAILRDQKEDERKWSGIDDFLKGKDRISKPELLNFLRGNELKIQEVEKGGESESKRNLQVNGNDEEGWFVDDMNLPSEHAPLAGPFKTEAEAERGVERIQSEEGIGQPGGPKFSQYQLPGGENYGELLLTLPQSEGKADFTLNHTKYGWQILDKEGKTATSQLYMEKADAEKAAKNLLPNAKLSSDFISPHFDEPNILAHVRYNDRITSDGKKALFLEELQSDWHQKGRRQGYQSDKPAFETLPDRYKIVETKDDEGTLRYRVVDTQIHGANGLERPVLTAWEYSREGAENAAINALNDTARGTTASPVPDAPFKKTWHEFALKRMIRYAAENGYDKLAWTTGEQQAERYDLSKQISRVDHIKNSDGTYDIIVNVRGRGPEDFREQTPDQLENLIGKDLTKKIVDGEGKSSEASGMKYLDGLDLKVGGEGMKGFYDKIIPAYLNKFGKKFGAEVGESKFELPKAEDIHGEMASAEEIAHAEGGTIKAHSIDITPEMRRAAIKEGFPLFQGEANKPRGAYLPAQRIIKLFQSQDPSTFAHESAHDWLEQMHTFVKSGQANQDYLDDWKVAADFLGVKEGQEKITEAQHEKFADAWEQYLSEGKAPSEELKSVFARFKDWLTQVYGSAKAALGGNLTDDMRGFFDRQLATKGEIEAARKETGQSDQDIPGADPEAQRQRRTLEEQARQKAEEILMKPQLDELKKENKEKVAQKRADLTEQAERDIKNQPLYRAQDDLKKQFGKMDVADIAKRYSEGRLEDEEAQKFEVTAELNGFSSGDEMAKAILKDQHEGGFKNQVKARVEGGMAPLAALKDTSAMKEEALKAVHNDKMTELLALEKQILSDMRDKREISAEASKRRREDASIAAKAAKDQAEELLSNKPISDAGRFRPYFTAERNAALRYDRAIRRGDLDAATKAKNEQMNAHAMAAEALRMKDRIDRWEKYVHDAQTDEREVFRDERHFVQVGALLERFGLPRADYDPKDRHETLAQWASRMEEKTNTVDIPDWIQDESISKDFDSLTAGELKDLKNTIKNIKHVAGFEDKAYSIFDKADMNEIADKLMASYREHAVEGKTPKLSLKEDNLDKLMRSADSFKLWLLRPETVFRKMDGRENFGSWWRAFYEKYSEGADEKARMLQDAAGRYNDIFSAYDKDELKQIANKKIFLPEIGASLTKSEIMTMALNTGNETNLQRLLEGRDWQEGQVKSILNRELNKRDWDTVQGIWNFVDSYWPKISELYRDLTGFAPDKVEAKPVMTPFGEYAGGYFPLRADPRFVIRAEEGQKADESLSAPPPAWRASTKNGFTKERVSGAKYPVSLDINGVQRHITDVIHDLTLRKWVLDANRLISRQDIQGALKDAVGLDGVGYVKDWVRFVAGSNGYESRDFFDSMAHELRNRGTIALLGLRISTILSQTHGLASYASVDPDNFGWTDVATSVANFYSQMLKDPASYKDGIKFIEDKSAYMMERERDMDRDLREAANSTWNKDNKMAKFAMSAFKTFDQLTSAPIWTQAYRKGLDLYENDDKKAVQYADMIIRRGTSSGREGDLPPVMRGGGRGGEVKKLFTMFYGFFSAQANQMYELLDEGKVGRAAGLFLGSTIPYALTHHGLPIDKKSGKEWLKEIIKYPFGLMPGIRDVADAGIDRILGTGRGDFMFSPAQEIPQSLLDAMSTTLSKRADFEKKGEALTRAAAMTVPYPDQANAWFWNTFDYLDHGMTPKLGDLMKRRPTRER